MNMMYLFELHYQIQKGIYFSGKVSTDAYNVYHSSKSDDMYWNYAIMSDLVPVKEIIEEIKSQFKKFDRPMCIYINSCQQKDLLYLQENKFRVNYTESWFRYDCDHLEGKVSAKQVETESDRENFIKIIKDYYGNPGFYGLNLTEDIIESLRESFNNEKYVNYIAYDGNIPAAVATIGNFNKYCMIFNIATRSEYENGIYQGAVMKSCIDHYKNIGGISLSMKTATNSKLEKWYEDNGFKKVYSGCRMSLEL